MESKSRRRYRWRLFVEFGLRGQARRYEARGCERKHKDPGVSRGAERDSMSPRLRATDHLDLVCRSLRELGVGKSKPRLTPGSLCFRSHPRAERFGGYQVRGFTTFPAISLESRKTHGTNAFGIGRSPVAPNWTIWVPAVVRPMNHVALDERNTAASNFPSPS